MRLDDDIHNFYEKLVLEEIEKRKLNERYKIGRASCSERVC